MRTGELKGRWWLAGQQEHSVPGTLELTQAERPRLVVSGNILGEADELEPLRSIFGRQREIGIVHGRTSSALDVTLANATLRVDEMEFGRPETATYEIVASAAYVGAHLDPATDRFARLSLEIPHLEVWRGAGSFSSHASPTWTNATTITVAANRPPPVVAQLPAGRLTVNAWVTVAATALTNARMELHCRLAVNVADPLLSLEWFERFVGPLGRLLALAAGRVLPVDTVAMATSAAADEVEVEVVWPHKVDLAESAKPPGPADLLFALPDLGSDPSAAVTAWLRACERYAPAMDAFFGTRSGEHMYEEDTFANLTRALEAYHRRRIGGRPDETKHANRVATILAIIPEAQRRWLKRALRGAGEYSLAQRICQTIQLHPWLVGDVIPGDTARWAERVAGERNLRTHHDPNALTAVASTIELVGMNQRLSVVLEASLLSELGFAEEQIAEMVHRASPAYRILALNEL
jgi:hypothetical protein